ncbi:MerR family transcriptional regulator [Bacillus thuringiensis]|uniref:MerR family transcriptional regulator n=1 Tax=Bacillus cereus group TaxID=86661 RepID=UPI000BFA2B11|nr:MULTISPECIES: MerR family transcriptional regulator [Bacillus cereus group]KAA6470326.1 MerR family transcriptional regulator [Bacillus cereus]MCU4986637.1 MerR family transcriptional regulator [Bacillus cereus]PFF57955.1 DNA-binding protein [Bacillus thuringiensis]PFJ10077.1 DNA-binding protein [Bacillus thuringiensis]PGX80028.1 DNA-binding protein [Bacillus thuringiensis]
MEYGYFAQEVAKQLEINANTLRRWSIELEKMDYTFERNDRNQRIYYQKDIEILRQMKIYLKQNWKLDEAAATVSNEDSAAPETFKDNTSNSPQDAENKLYEGINATETDSVHGSDNADITLLEAERSQEESFMMKERFVHMFEQQDKIVQQNQTIIDLLIQERSIAEEKDQEIKLLQNKLDKAITLLQEDKKEIPAPKKSLIQRLFNL